MTLFRYLSWKFLRTFFMVFAVLFTLYALIDSVEVASRFTSANLTLSQILTLTVLRISEGLYQLMPLMILLATVAVFLSLARSSEMVIIRAAGRSALRAVMAPVSMSILIGLFSLMILNPMVAATNSQYAILSARYLSGTGSTLSVSNSGLWLREGGPDGQTVIRAASASADGAELFNVRFHKFDPSGNPTARIEARAARLNQGFWQIDEFQEWRFAEDRVTSTEPEIGSSQRIASTLTQEQIQDGVGAPSHISFWNLPDHIRTIKAAGFSGRRHEVWLQVEIARPALLAAMVLIGAAFTMRPARFGHSGIMVTIALLVGFGAYFIRNLAHILAENGQIPILLGAWVPPLAAILLATALILHLEDG